MLKSNYVDPVFQSPARVEFKLQSAGECVYNTMEITNFGFSSTSGTVAPAVPKLKFGGIMNIIRNAYLYSGVMELESIKDVCVLAGITAVMGDADMVKSLEQPQNQSTVTATSNATNSVILDTQQQPGLLGNVKLQDVFPCLRQMKKLVNFPELRVVFELNTTIADMFQNQGAGSVPTGYTLSSPVLRFDTLDDLEMKQEQLKDPENYASVQWMTLYSEIQTLVAGTTTASLKLRGFSNKSCQYILVQGVPSNARSHPYIGFGYSPVYNNEVMQMTVNNRKLLPLAGLDTPAKKQLSMESFKPSGFYGTGQQGGTGFTAWGSNADQLLGNLSFAKFNVAARITDLQFDYQTAAVAGANRELRFIGAVSKQLVRDSKSGAVLEVVY